MKDEKRVILGEIGFKHEIDLFRKDPENHENILYYPNEYFNENIEKIGVSFDIWSLGVVFWEILTGNKLFKNQNEIEDIDFFKNIKTPNICTELEEFILK